jgi:hypothetical protein
MKNLFPIKSVGLLLVSSFIRSLSKTGLDLSLDDLKMVSLDIGNYQTFYSVYRKVDASRYIF